MGDTPTETVRWSDCPHCGAAAVGHSGRCARCLRPAGSVEAAREPWYALPARRPGDGSQAVGLALVAIAATLTYGTPEAPRLVTAAAALTWLARCEPRRALLLALIGAPLLALTVATLLAVWAVLMPLVAGSLRVDGALLRGTWATYNLAYVVGSSALVVAVALRLTRSPRDPRTLAWVAADGLACLALLWAVTLAFGWQRLELLFTW